MERKFKEVSDDVIFVEESNQYFARVVSAEALHRKLYNDEVEYGTVFHDITIDLREAGHFTDGILITLSRDDENDKSEKIRDAFYIDIIQSDTLGMFISDWY